MRGRVRGRGCEWVRCTYKRTYGRIHTPGHIHMPSFIHARRRRPSLVYIFNKNGNNKKLVKKINSCRMRGRIRGGGCEWVHCSCKYTCVRIHTYTQNANTHTHTHSIHIKSKNIQKMQIHTYDTFNSRYFWR